MLTIRYNFCYTLDMKTAISLPDNVYESAEKLASRLGKSRSQLYKDALTSYIDKNKSTNITAKLNDVYSATDLELDKALVNLQFRSISKEEW
jgi:metal-responsive CopG/Arc/MetJ family transcriptional regulator